MKTAVDLILDCGAYTTWRKGKVIDLPRYIKFIQKHQAYLTAYVNLDVIPGAVGVVPTADQVEASAEAGWKNLLTMRKEGLDPMPVFHMGERMGWLDQMIDSGCEYIGISPANDRTTDQKQAWLDEVFGRLCGSNGFPKVKTHGFGVTALPLLYRYPWYSADSLTWVLIAAYGGILVPRSTSRGYDWQTPPLTVQVSHRTKTKANIRSETAKFDRHFDGMGENHRAYVRKFVEDMGLDFEELHHDFKPRMRVCARYFANALAHHQVPPFVYNAGGLFGKVAPGGAKNPPFDRFHLVYTETSADEVSAVLLKEGIRDRLLSFAHFNEGQAFDLEKYVMTGLIPERPKKAKKPLERKRLTPS